MLSVSEALAHCLELGLSTRSTTCSLIDPPEDPVLLMRRRLAASIFASAPLPRWDQSAMDGYAVRAEDLLNDQPLRVIEVIPAGTWPERSLEAGQAARIFTGAPLPQGADTVVIQEDCEALEGGWVKFKATVKRGAHIRRRGEEIETGDLLGECGQLITPGHLGLWAAQGLREVQVWDAPRVALLETGSELVEPGSPLEGAQIYATHAATLAPLIAQSGGHLMRRARVVDDVERVVQLLSELADSEVDLIITTGGVSVGDFDPLHEALERLAAQRHFWKVRMKPGKPLSVASLSRPQAPSIPLFGLPGNPVSCVVSYLLFIHPLLQRASGTPQGEWGLRRLTCTLAEPISKRHQRAEFFRVRLSRAEQARSSGTSSWLCELAGGQSSGWISSIASGDALLETPAEPIEWPLGHQVEVSLFPWWSG